MRIKEGVTVNGVQPECIMGLLIAETVFQNMGYSFTVTSLTDGASWRKPGSLHLAGLAFDIRTWDIPESQIELVCDNLRKRLGPEFDVVLEPDHIHVELDVRDRTQARA